MDSYQYANDSDFAKNKADVSRRLYEVERLVKEQKQKAQAASAAGETAEFSLNETDLNERLGHGQQVLLLESNATKNFGETDGKDDQLHFELQLKESKPTPKPEIVAGKKGRPADKSEGLRARIAETASQRERGENRRIERGSVEEY